MNVIGRVNIAKDIEIDYFIYESGFLKVFFK